MDFKVTQSFNLKPHNVNHISYPIFRKEIALELQYSNFKTRKPEFDINGFY